MRQDQAQDVTLVNGTGDRGEKCLGKQGRNNRSFHVPGGGKVREQKRKEKRKETKMENCVKKKSGIGLAGMHHPSLPGPSRGSSHPRPGLQGPQVTDILPPSPVSTPPS